MLIINTEHKYGFHVEKQPSIFKTVKDTICDTNMTAAQIYISNSRKKNSPKFDYKELNMTREMLSIYDHIEFYIHANLTYNLAGTTIGESDPLFQNSLELTIKFLASELDYCVAMGAKGVVVHPGSRKNKSDGLKCISATINKVLTLETPEIKEIAKHMNISVCEAMKKRILLLENCAGEGTKLCQNYEEFVAVFNNINDDLKDQMGICIDTCHAFAAGWINWSEEGAIEKFYDDFNNLIGLKYLKLFHFNDAKKKDNGKGSYFGSKLDRHEQLGDGYIFGDGKFCYIKIFMLKALEHKISIIGEPPISGKVDRALVNHLLLDEHPLFYLY